MVYMSNNPADMVPSPGLPLKRGGIIVPAVLEPSLEDIAARLETKGWIDRHVMPRRQRSLSLTPAGEEVLLELKPGVGILSGGMMASLEPAEQREFMRLLRKFVHLHDSQNSMPAKRPATATLQASSKASTKTSVKKSAKTSAKTSFKAPAKVSVKLLAVKTGPRTKAPTKP